MKSENRAILRASKIEPLSNTMFEVKSGNSFPFMFDTSWFLVWYNTETEEMCHTNFGKLPKNVS